MSTIFLDKAKLNLKFLKDLAPPSLIKFDSLQNLTISLIEKNSIQFLILTNRGQLDDNLKLIIQQFKTIYPHITFILIQQGLKPDEKNEYKYLDYIFDYASNKKDLCNTLAKIFNSKANLPIIKNKYLTINPNSQLVHRGKRTIQLTKKEFELLELLVQNPNRIFSRVDLLELVWNYKCDNLSNTVDVHISTLRQKLNKGFKTKLIRTIYNQGYQFTID